MKFTIITGTGRCGTSALTKFFIETGKFKLPTNSGEIKGMRAGYECHESSIINALVSEEVIFKHLEHNNPHSAIEKIKRITSVNDIVKTPTFFFYNTYESWKRYSNKDIQVILLKRNDFSNVFNSANLINKSSDWGYFKSTEQIERHYQKNILNLKDNNIKYVEIEFPKFIFDISYFTKKIMDLEMSLTEEDIEIFAKKVFNKDKINFL